MKLLLLALSLFTGSLSFAQSGSRGGGGSGDGLQATRIIQQTLNRILQHYQTIQDERSTHALEDLQKDLIVLMVTPPAGQNSTLLKVEQKNPSIILVNEKAWENESNLFTLEQSISLFLAHSLNLPQIENYLEKDREDYQKLYLRRTFRCLVGSSYASIRPSDLVSQPITLNNHFKVSVELGSVLIENLKTQEVLTLNSLFYPYFYGEDHSIIQTLAFKDGKTMVSCD